MKSRGFLPRLGWLRNGCPERNHFEQVAPAATQTDLDGVGACVRPSAVSIRQSSQIRLILDDPSTSGQAGCECEPHQTQCRLCAQGTRRCCLARVICPHPEQFQLRITHIVARYLAGAHPSEQLSSGQPIVHAAGNPALSALGIGL